MLRWLPLVLILASCATLIACVASSRARGENGGESTASADDVEISYRVEGAEHGDPTVVFVHGFGCDSSSFDAAIAHVAQRMRVVAIDLPGHGRSGANRVNWTMEAYGDDVRRVCDALAAEQVILVGHSMGGPVILEAAREMTDRVLALIPVETFHDVDQKLTDEQIAQIIDLWRQDFDGSAKAMISSTFHQPIRDPKLVETVTAKMIAMPRNVALALLDSMFHYDAGAALDDITLPVRCINSGERETNLAAGRRHAKRFDARTIPAVGHYLMLEDPDAFNALLDAAIDELTR